MPFGSQEIWPWSDLGIEETADKKAIRAAFAAKKASLDGSMRISAFARLTEAREKALFLASELQRAAERGGKGAAAKHSIVAPPPVPELPKAPEPPRIEVPAYEELDPEDFRPEPVDARVLKKDLPKPQPQPQSQPQPQPEVPPAVYTDPGYNDSHYGSGNGSSPADYSVARRQQSTFIDRYGLDKNPHYWVIGFVFFLGFCSLLDDDEEQYADMQPLEIEENLAPAPSPADLTQDPALEPVLVELFGEGTTYDSLASQDREFAETLAFQLSIDGFDPEPGRAYLRHEIMRVRPVVAKEDLLDASRLYLGWLRQAREQGTDSCRNVHGRMFNNGEPTMDAEAMEAERALARSFVQKRNFSRPTEGGSSINFPAWLIRAAEERTGLADRQLFDVLGDVSSPARCDVVSAFVDIILAQPDEDVLPVLEIL